MNFSKDYLFCTPCTLRPRGCQASGFEPTPTEESASLADPTPGRQYVTCMHYTCVPGQFAAALALHEAELNSTPPLTIAAHLGEVVQGFPFGSQHKPVSLGRLVAEDGAIFTRSGDGSYFRSPQRLSSRLLTLAAIDNNDRG